MDKAHEISGVKDKKEKIAQTLFSMSNADNKTWGEKPKAEKTYWKQKAIKFLTELNERGYKIQPT